MSTVRFTEDHEYVRVDGDIGTIGITDYAQGQLGDVVFVELPEAGKTVSKGDELAVVESVKAAGEVMAPVSGEVTEINGELEASPGRINEDAAGEGWIAKIRLTDPAELDDLMDGEAYAAFTRDLE